MMLQVERVVATGTAALDSGIGDTALKTFNGDTYLYSVTGKGGGIVSWRLVDGAAPQIEDQQYFDVSIAPYVGRIGMPVTLAGQDKLILDVSTATGLIGYDLNPDGTLGALQETDSLTSGGSITGAVQLSVGGTGLLTLAHQATGQIGSYWINSDSSLTPADVLAGHADSLKSLQVGSQSFVVVSDSANSTIRAYSVNQSTGALGQINDQNTIQMLGINAPTSIEVTQAYGQSWVVVAGSVSNSLSVMRLDATGQLIPTDHALDTLHTRFASVQDLSVVKVNGHVFVLAGGGDDGITLFSLTPDGQLIHRDSIADTLASGLQNVESLTVAHIGEELQIFVASQEDAGLTQLSVSVANLGIVTEGYGLVSGSAGDDLLSGGLLDSTLIGGGGDDILITGTSSTTMTGGAGADIFVIRQDSGRTTITDFQAGQDQLDLTNYAFLRSPAQLSFTSTSQGAQIQYQGEDIELVSASGGPLTSTDVFGSGFTGADHIPTTLNSGPDNNAAPGVLGHVTIDSRAPNDSLRGAEVQFTPVGGNMIAAQANALGQFDLGLPDGTFAGQLDVLKSYSTASNEITALDALQVLRMAVGLDPTWGPAAPENWIAADITRDGTVTALDALAVLQVAVGLPTPNEAEWVFLDANTDLSGISRSAVNYQTGAPVTVVDDVFTADMTSILLGNLEAV